MKRIKLLVSVLACLLLGFLVVPFLVHSGRSLGYLSPIWDLLFPPDDLWIPLASIHLNSAEERYTFPFRHKYSGEHEINIVFPKTEERFYPELTSKETPYPQISLAVEISTKTHVVFKQSLLRPSPFTGISENGFRFVSYNVPKNAPVRTELEAKITINGDLGQFLSHYKGARLEISKGSEK